MQNSEFQIERFEACTKELVCRRSQTRFKNRPKFHKLMCHTKLKKNAQRRYCEFDQSIIYNNNFRFLEFLTNCEFDTIFYKMVIIKNYRIQVPKEKPNIGEGLISCNN